MTKGTTHAASKDKPIDAPVKSAAAAAPKKAAAAPAKPPKCELVGGKKWEIEHQVKNQACNIESEVKQVVYVYQCVDSVIQVSGKANAITLDGCKKCAIVFDSVVAGIELINCTSCKVQVLDRVMTVTVDKCSGTQVRRRRPCRPCRHCPPRHHVGARPGVCRLAVAHCCVAAVSARYSLTPRRRSSSIASHSTQRSSPPNRPS